MDPQHAIDLEHQKPLSSQMYIIQCLLEIFSSVKICGLMLHHDNASNRYDWMHCCLFTTK